MAQFNKQNKVHTDCFSSLQTPAPADTRNTSKELLCALTGSEIAALLQRPSQGPALLPRHCAPAHCRQERHGQVTQGEKQFTFVKDTSTLRWQSSSSSSNKQQVTCLVRAWLQKGTLQRALNAPRATLSRKKGISFQPRNYCSNIS